MDGSLRDKLIGAWKLVGDELRLSSAAPEMADGKLVTTRLRWVRAGATG